MAAIVFTQRFHYFMKFPLNFHKEIHIKNISAFFADGFRFLPWTARPYSVVLFALGGGGGKVKI
jgi:hypothetical protein